MPILNKNMQVLTKNFVGFGKLILDSMFLKKIRIKKAYSHQNLEHF